MDLRGPRAHVMALLLVVAGCSIPTLPVPNLVESDPNALVSTGEAAKKIILKWADRNGTFGETGRDLPASATDFWVYDGGNFGGSINYSVFKCGNREDCLKAVKILGGRYGPDTGDLKPWESSRYAVVMEGPDYYWKGHWKEKPETKRFRSNPWDVRAIKNGLVHEAVFGDHDRMDYYAIDLDRKLVYYHFESGGFPRDEFRPDKDEE
jgi:hypothetical protein